MSEYNHNAIEEKWQKDWRKNKTYKATESSSKEKFYVLDMFPYPSGAGLHVGHPLGYIASDIYARYKKNEGFNVLHPMGYDSFGLPAEQYAIQTGQHPAVTTKVNIDGGVDKQGNVIDGYRKQLDIMGFAFDWDREVRTSSPEYYKWTQWIFKQIFNSWYNKNTDKAENITTLTAVFEAEGNANVNAVCDEVATFSAEDWNAWSEAVQRKMLMNYRLTFLADSWVNWCPVLGTVLANDEIKDGVSERGGHPVEQKLMRQWSMRISAYAERLLKGLNEVDFSDSLKEQQRNWIGKSQGASVQFTLEGRDDKIEVFTTRPDTIFGVTFMVLAPEHELVDEITTEDNKAAIAEYKTKAAAKTERDRQANVKDITGQFTGAYALHPFTGEKVEIWIGEYVLASYGTGAVMAVPAGDQRDYDFAKHFGIDIPNIFEGKDISEEAYTDKDAVLANSDFLNNLPVKQSIVKAIEAIEAKGFGKGKTLYRLRDAIFSRQRYWGEPFPVYYKGDTPHLIEDEKLPVTLPEVDKYLPTEEGEPPLARAERVAWDVFEGDRMEYNTMPGWAGSSWYFLRYMDPNNLEEFVSKEKAEYWNQVDLYIGGAEHATGHLLYSRFWTKFLCDMGYIAFNEPFKKLINQGMILGRSSFVYKVKDENKFVSFGLRKEHKTQRLHADISNVVNDELNVSEFKKWRPEFADAEFVLEGGKYICGSEIEKMSKSKYNVQTPDELVEKYGADTLRCYEMFLGPLEQAKPWDVQGISGVNNFLKKLWRLFHQGESFTISEQEPTKENLKSLHQAIKKVTEDITRYSFNTVVSTLMIAVNELGSQKCNNKAILSDLVVLVSPFAPHIAEELWSLLGNASTVTVASWPKFEATHLVESDFEYPVSFNGKMRFKISLPVTMGKEEVEKALFEHEKTAHYLDGKDPKKVIVVPKRIINVVV
ncbi:leucine--tRNA ligase [Flavobacteriales bacterium]|nr:leucine--tRNA ligase [Flavobacteriales bacterium]